MHFMLDEEVYHRDKGKEEPGTQGQELGSLWLNVSYE